jgi:hypothetical protein
LRLITNAVGLLGGDADYGHPKLEKHRSLSNGMRIGLARAWICRSPAPLQCVRVAHLRPGARSREQQQYRSWIENYRDHEDEIPEDVLVAGADRRRELSDRAQVSVGHLPVALDPRFPDLDIGEGLILLLALRGELHPITADQQQLHGGVGAPVRGGLIHSRVYLRSPAVPATIGLSNLASASVLRPANPSLAPDLVTDVRLGEEAVAAYTIETHQNRNQ